MIIKFLERLVDIISKTSEAELGRWNSDGTIFYIYNIDKFEKFIVPYNLKSLRKQLKYYSFVFNFLEQDAVSISHPYFLKQNYKNLSENTLKKFKREKIKEFRKSRIKKPKKQDLELELESEPESKQTGSESNLNESKPTALNNLQNRLFKLHKSISILKEEINYLNNIYCNKILSEIYPENTDYSFNKAIYDDFSDDEMCEMYSWLFKEIVTLKRHEMSSENKQEPCDKCESLCKYKFCEVYDKTEVYEVGNPSDN